MKTENKIELEILIWIRDQGCMCRKDDMKGYFDQKAGKFKAHVSPFIERGRSDIVAIIGGVHISIEVKKPSEMSFFDRSLYNLENRLSDAQTRSLSKQGLKKYVHAVEQRRFLDRVIKSGGIGFFSSSLEQTKKRLKNNGFIIE